MPPDPESQTPEDQAKAANRSADMGCLLFCIAGGMVLLSFILGAIYEYRQIESGKSGPAATPPPASNSR